MLNSTKRLTVGLWCTALLLCAGVAHAEPLQLGLQGRLTNVSGSAAADGAYGLAISFYEQPTAGSAVFQEKFLAVAVQGGVFAVTLGADVIKLDSALFATGKSLWVGVQVGGDPELTRQVLLRVPYAVHALQATNSADLQCSGCVGSDDLAKAAVTGEKIAQGAVGANHVSFAWAAGDSPGGAATFALAANTAKLADQAKAADLATFADEAGAANKAKLAADLQCTGCVQAGDLDPAVLAPYAKTADLGVYAKTADLGAVAKLGSDNIFTAKNAFAGLSTSAPIDFAKNEAKLMRFHNAATAPAACDASSLGLVYYNTTENALYVCNGKDFALFATAVALGTDGNPAGSCKVIKDAVPAASDGLYWLDPDGKSGPLNKFQAWCDMTTEGGGWTELLRCVPGDNCAVGGVFLYTIDWTGSDKGVVATNASYLHGLSVKPIFTASKEFLISVDDTAAKQTGHLKFTLDAATQQFFNAPSRYESGALTWTLIDGDGSKSVQSTRICWQPAGTSYNIRSIQGASGLKFLGQTSIGPNGSANSDCDYGPWNAQILIRSGSGSLSANFGSSYAATWSAQQYAHRVLVR